MDSDAALIASTSYGVSGLSAMTVMTTWTSLRRPFLKVGRSGRSIRRQVRIASSPGTTLAAEERAGDLARGVHPLLDVDRQGEEVEVVLGVLAGRGGRQQHGVVVEVGGDRAGGLAGEEPGLELDGAGAELAVVENGLDGGDDGSLSQWGQSLSVRGAIRGVPLSGGALESRSRRVPRRACCEGAGLRSRPAGPAVASGRSRKPLPRTGPDVAGRSWCVFGVQLWCGSDPSGGRARNVTGAAARTGSRSACEVSDAGRGARRSSGSARCRSSAGS